MKYMLHLWVTSEFCKHWTINVMNNIAGNPCTRNCGSMFMAVKLVQKVLRHWNRGWGITIAVGPGWNSSLEMNYHFQLFVALNTFVITLQLHSPYLVSMLWQTAGLQCWRDKASFSTSCCFRLHVLKINSHSCWLCDQIVFFYLFLCRFFVKGNIIYNWPKAANCI